MLARAVSLSALARALAALTLCTAATAVHHDAFSRTPRPATRTAGTAASLANPPTISLTAIGVGTTITKDDCVTASAGAGAAFECGDLRLVHPLPTTTTMGRAHTPTLIYNSRHKNGISLFPVDVYEFPSTVASLTAKVVLTTAAGVVKVQSSAIGWSAWALPMTKRISIPVNTSTLTTGAYPYKVVVDFTMIDGSLVERTASSVVAIVNRAQGPFGRGWWLDGLEQLVVYDNTHELWVGGDGSTRLYTKSTTKTSIWTVTPTVDRPDTLEQVSTSVWRRHLRNGAYVEFDNTGRHTKTVNRSGYTTSFLYENTSRPTQLTTIKLPVPPQSPLAANPPSYRFTYATTWMSGIDAPAVGAVSRRVSLAQDAAGVTTTVTNPDGRTIKFDESATGIVRRTDQRGFATTYAYEPFGGTLVSSTVGMQGTAPEDITTYFTAAERAGVAGNSAVDTASVTTSITAPGFVWPISTTFGVDRFGGVRWVRNAVHEQTTLFHGDARFPNAVTKVIHPNGFTTVATYTDRGLLATVTDSQPWVGLNTLNPTTRYRWSTGKFDVLAAIVHPAGDSITFGYFTNGDRQWEQLGSSTTRRVQYRYGPSRQLSAVASPGNNPVTEVDSVEYDRNLGNVSRTLTPLRIATRYHMDAIGRVDSVYAPGASGTQRVTATTYDLMDRPLIQVDAGAKTSYTLGATYLSGPVQDTTAAGTTRVQHYYDAAGNDTLIERGAAPNPTNIALRQTYAHFDGASRKVWELSAAGGVRQWQYDPAGNVVATITPRRDTITMQYDALNRLTQKITPAVRYEPALASDGPTAIYSARFPNFADGYSHDWHVQDDPMPPPLIIPGDTTVFEYDDVSNDVATAWNHDAYVARFHYPNGTLSSEAQDLRSLGPEEGWAYDTHKFSVEHQPNVNGQLSQRFISAPGNCTFGSCTQTNTYDQDTGELFQIRDDADAFIQFFRDPALRTVTTREIGSGLAGGTSFAEQFVQRDADGRVVSRYAGPTGAPLFTDGLAYDGANRVVSSSTSFATDAPRSTLVDNAYSSLGALAATIRTRGGVTVSDKYETDAFANVSAHTSRNLTDNRGAVVNGYGYTSADRQLSSLMTPIGWQPETPPIDVLEETFATTFDASGNRISFQKSLQKYDRIRREYVGANYGREWNWNAYDAEDRLRVSQRSFFSDSVTLRTVFIEYSYDPFGRRIQTRTRWDMHCQPGQHGECHPSVERTIWDGNQIVQEMRSGAYDVIPESAGETDPCVDGSDWSTKPWCAPGYVPPPVPVRYVQSGLDLESTGGDFEGVVRYVNGDGIDEPIVVRKSNLGTFVPLRSARGLVEDGLFIDGTAPAVSWTARDIDVYGAHDMLTATPIEPTHWLGSLIGDRRDAAGLVYMRNRYYDPSAGRFTQEDPIGLAGGLNLYGFADGDPVNFSDPLGLAGCKLGTNCWAEFKRQWSDPNAHPVRDFFKTMGAIGRVVGNPALLETGGAASASSEVGVGTKVYRVFGGESKEMGGYWTTVNPSTVPGYAAKAGLPAGNTATELVEGVITDTRGIVVTKAAPGAQGPGGIRELQVPNPPRQVKVTGVKPFDPPS